MCSSDKKCTYGIKCKFYHPERANQSYLSLADELREKAQISAGKEEKNTKLSPRHLHTDPSPAHNACTHPQDKDYPREQQSSSHLGQITENALLYWEDSRKCLNNVPGSVTGYQNEWAGLHSGPSHCYANLDSGFGSFENCYSDFSHYLSNSQGPRPQKQLTGSRQGSAHLEKNKASQSCVCCSQVVPSAAHQQHRGPSKDQAYSSHMFSLGVPHQHSLPSRAHYNGVTHHQQNYWSDPFQGFPRGTTSRSLPSAAHTSYSSCCSFTDPQYHSWGQQQSTSFGFDPQRMELRSKLHAIFNPHQVDKVMEMFPHLMDAEKLAAEILNLKAQGGIF